MVSLLFLDQLPPGLDGVLTFQYRDARISYVSGFWMYLNRWLNVVDAVGFYRGPGLL